MAIHDFDRCVLWTSLRLLERWYSTWRAWFGSFSTTCKQDSGCRCCCSWFLVMVGRNPWLLIPIWVRVVLLVVVVRMVCDFVLSFVDICDNSSYSLPRFFSFFASSTVELGDLKFWFHRDVPCMVSDGSHATAWPWFVRRVSTVVFHGITSRFWLQMCLWGVEVMRWITGLNVIH